MIPAKGELQLDKEFTFKYNLSDNPNAAVHVGWFVAMAYMSRSIEHKIDSCYKVGIKDFILTGHSQGGGITFLLNSYLEGLKTQHKIPEDIRFKTYCSAAPKPGNLFFAYHYESITRDWAYNTINAADWVPETPFSVQTINDLNCTNPITDAKSSMGGLPFFARIVVKRTFNRLDRPTRRSQRRFEKTSKKVGKILGKSLPGYEEPETAPTAAYVRCGTFVTMLPDAAYYAKFPDDSNNKFEHHMLLPYLYLMEKL